VRALRARGVGPGSAVALMCSNRPEFVEVYAAVLRGGYRLTAINWHLQVDEAAYIVGNCEARAFIADAAVADVAAAVGERIDRSVVKLAVGGPIGGFDAYDDVVAEQNADNIEDPSFGGTMLYTSGTTGRPKGVYRARAAQVTQTPTVTTTASRSPMISGKSMCLCTGPLYHAAPFAYNLAQPINYGVGVVLMGKWDPEQTLALIDEHRVTHTHLVATMFHRILALPEEVRRRYDTSSLQLVVHGAAPTPVHVKRAMIDWWGPILYEYYAGTEGGGTAIHADDWLQKPGSVGKPTMGRVVEILDDDGEPVPTGTVGRVFFQAPKTGRFEYFKDADKTAGAYVGDRFTLGDHGYLDEDGYLFLTGRTSELIISGGVNIYPAEIDDVLLQHPAVADVACVGVPNEEMGEEVKAVVVLRPGHEPSAEVEQMLIAHAREHLAGYKRPRSVDFVAELPRSDAGKIYRARVRKEYWKHLEREI
jgi:long-chain acyl-CoA synthetase